jgi:anti-sigma regulatory factor (Ser/Thr protein kinase)
MRALLRRWLMHAGATDEDVAETLAAVGEAAANAIEHAGLSSRQEFRLEGVVQDGRVELVVSDPGRWREGGAEGRGRGVPLMRELMDTVDMTHTEAGTTVTMTRRLRVPSDPASV